jgi:hypothetical protein
VKHKDAITIFRFLGTSPDSSNIFRLLQLNSSPSFGTRIKLSVGNNDLSNIIMSVDSIYVEVTIFTFSGSFFGSQCNRLYKSCFYC